jgi:hypothetical protein
METARGAPAGADGLGSTSSRSPARAAAQAPQPQLGRAQAQAAAGRKPDAIRSLRRALELGLSPQDLARVVDTNDAFAKLRADADVRALLAPPASP